MLTENQSKLDTDLRQFFANKLQSLDIEIKHQQNQMQKLNLVTMRSSYSKLMSNFLKDDTELSRSHFQQAKIYLRNGKIDQAISQAQLAKKKIILKKVTNQNQKQNQQTGKQNFDNENKENLNNKSFLQTIKLFLIQCNIQSKKYDAAQQIIDDIEISDMENQQKYLNLKGKIYQKLQKQAQSKEIYQQLYKLTIDKYGKQSLEDGLCLIQMGKNQGSFQNHQQAIDLLNQGIQILISKRYQNPQHVATIYENLADYCRLNQDFQKEYSSLICAFSMIKQLNENQQKRTIQVLQKLSNNLLRKQEKQKALEYLIQVQQIQRKIYGQSSTNLSKTVKKIINIFTELNKLSQVKKYQNQYEHLLGNKKPSQSRVTHNVSTPNKINPNHTRPSSSVQKQKLSIFNNKDQ